MRLLFVSNPSSGSSDGDVLARVEARLGDRGDVTPFSASSAEAFEEELSAAASGFDTVVIAGGDGTFSRAVNTLVDDDIVFGLIPTGTGNDLATTLSLGDDPEEAAARIVDGRAIRLDLGSVTAGSDKRFFVNACVGGFSVAVDEALEEETKRKLGRFAFWLGGVRAAADIKRYRVRIDGQEIEDGVVVGIGNGRTVGGGLELWPDAQPDDGILEACVIAAPDLSAGVRAAAKVKAATHPDTEGVTMLRGSRIVVEAEPDMEINVDGEIIGIHTPATFEVARSFRMLVPPSGP